ncbi:MAG: histidine kinase dimerization/phospho-acceptor domain-containing protein, partial [Patescibacteria group bacterium]
MFFSYFYNVDFLIVGICMAAIGLLGFIIVLNKPHSATHRAFFLFSLLTIAYGMTNFLNHQVDSLFLVLWYLRFTIFFGVWHAFSFLHLVTVFPDDKRIYAPAYKYILVPLTIIISILTLTPYMLQDVGSAVVGEVSNPIRGPLISLFGGLVLCLLGRSGFILIQKTRHARGILYKQLLSISIGAFITFISILIFNVLFPLVFHIQVFVPLAPVYFLPFIGFTAYAIMRYQFLSVKVIATEIFSFILAIILLTEIDFTADMRTTLFRLGSFALFIIFSYYLIQSVHKEVESRAQIEKLAGELKKTNAELARVNQAKSDFLSMASHQLKTPLSIIKGYLSMVLEGSFGSVGEVIHTQLNKVYISNERLISLVEDLLNFSRLEEGRMQYNKEPA